MLASGFRNPSGNRFAGTKELINAVGFPTSVLLFIRRLGKEKKDSISQKKRRVIGNHEKRTRIGRSSKQKSLKMGRRQKSLQYIKLNPVLESLSGMLLGYDL